MLGVYFGPESTNGYMLLIGNRKIVEHWDVVQEVPD
jgi:hypothetical protein